MGGDWIDKERERGGARWVKIDKERGKGGARWVKID